MQSSTPLAKLSRPRLTRTVPRSRLFSRLDVMRKLSIVWVSGPPGVGKTALLASYLDQCNAAGVWYRVDAGDADPWSFFGLLAQTLESDASVPMAPINCEQTSDITSFARQFFRSFFARSSARSVIVLDNFERAPNLASLLRQALEEIPAGMSILVASRAGPPSVLARYVAHGQIGHLEWNDLKLTPEESDEIALVHGVQDSEATSQLHHYCDGWPAGLTIGLANHQQGRCLPSRSATEVLRAYFATEIFDALDEGVRSTLLATASFSAFTPAMAAVVAGPQAPVILDHLHRHSCFVSWAEPAGLYRYHNLFRDFLISRLECDCSPDRVLEIRGGCARLLGEADQIDCAIDLYAKIGYTDELKTLIATHADALFRSGQWQTLERWLSLLPAAVVESDGWLTYWQAVMKLSTSPADAQKCFEAAYQKFARLSDQTGQFLAAIGAIEAIFARVDSYLDLDEWIRVLEPHMFQAYLIAEDGDRTRGWYAFLQATLMRRPDHPLIPVGITWLREGLRGGSFSAAETVSAGAVLLFYGCVAADEAVVREAVSASAEAAHREDLPPVARWSWHYWHGLFWLWRLEYGHAVQCWEHCTRISEQCGLGALDWLIHGNLVMIDLAEDRLEQAEQRLGKLWRAGSGGHMMAYALYWMGEMFLRLFRQRSDLPEAIKAIVECSRITGFFNLEMLCLSDAAAVHLLRDEDDAAAALVEEVAARVDGTVVRQCDGQVVALRAGLLYRAGQIEQAHRTFAEALDLVMKGGTCACMLWVRAGLSTLFGAALQISRYAPLVRDLVRRYQVPPPKRAGSEWPWPVRIHSLGQLRIEVDDTLVPFGRKAQQKVLELLKALIAEGGREVDGGIVADWLWPDVDGDAAQSNLRGTVKRLRELLGHPESVRLFDGKISLNERICWLDLWVFREWCGALLEGAVGGEQHTEQTQHLQNLYRGPLLNGEDAPWLQPARRRERLRIGRVLARLSSHDESVACRLRDHALMVDPDLAAA